MDDKRQTIGCCQLFASFCKIGAFTIGGGYAMIPLMEQELVDKLRCMSREEFLDLLSVVQALPGVFAVNMASSVGYSMRGIKGSVAAIIGTIIVPIAAIILLAMFFRHFRDNEIVERIFKGVRPVVVALIAAPVVRLAATAQVSWRNVWMPITAALLIWLLGVSPIWIVAATLLLGVVTWIAFVRKKGGAQ